MSAGLAEQQRRFRDAVVDGTFAAGVSGRLDVYRQAVPARLTAALRDNFGTLAPLMGDEAFDALAAAYQRAHPSRHPSIRWFGSELPAFMAERDDLVPHPAMVDLARFEWAMRDAFDAADAEPVDAAALARLPGDAWPGLVLHLHPATRLLALDWAIAPAWRLLRQHADDPSAPEPEVPEPEAEGHTVLVWRQALSTRWRSVSATEADVLAQGLAGAPFAQLCETAANAAEPGDVAAVVGFLQQWLADGLVTGLG